MNGDFSRPADGVYYHYTSRSTAQEISIAGYLLMGRDGFIYLTDELYPIGWQATDYLALPEKNAEVAISINEVEIPRQADGSTAIEYLGITPEWPASSGRSRRRGGARQWVIRTAIPLDVASNSWIELQIP